MTDAVEEVEERIERARDKRFRESMSAAGIPLHLWDTGPENSLAKWPVGSALTSINKFADSLPIMYDKGSNLRIVGGDLMKREQVAAWLARRCLQTDNKYYRYFGEHKHRDEGDTAPFTVKMMGLPELERMFKEAGSDDSDPFEVQVCAYDFFFLTEVGREYANSFIARILMDFLVARIGEELPTIVTFAKDLGNAMDKEGGSPYWEVDSFVKFNFKNQVTL